MAEVTTLEEKLAEVIGLAQAAQGATEKVEGLVEDEKIKERLQQMREEAEETERRTDALIDGLEGKKTAIREKGRETKSEAAEMIGIYLGEDSDELDGFEFLTMAEAGELGHWQIVREMSERIGAVDARSLAEWAIPIQERHERLVRQTSLELAAEEAAAA